MAFINHGEMKATEYIAKTREYLFYLEEHIENVRRAFIYISEMCKDMAWVCDDFFWHTMRHKVLFHDLSKFSKDEFVQYRDSFYPVNETDKANSGMGEAWKNHKEKNHHHHETVKDYFDIVHMVIDWTAMGYKFGNTAQQYYEANKDKINLSDEHLKFMYEIFDHINDNE